MTESRPLRKAKKLENASKDVFFGIMILMNILFGTNNKDKFRIVSSVLKKVAPEIFLHNLNDAGLSGEVEEVGTIDDRSKQKAEFYLKQLLSKDDSGYSAVLGVDDGFAVDDGEPSPDSKEITDRVLSGIYEPGTSFDVCRSYALIDMQGRVITRSTRTPFTVLENYKWCCS